MVAKINSAESLNDDELTPYQLKQAAYYQSPEGLAKLEANQKTAANINALKQQILGQNQTSKWTGEGYGSAEKNANAMAELLAKAGITDIKQFGKVDKYEPVQVVGYSLNGKQVQNPSKGVYYESIPEPDGEGGISGYRRRDLTPAEIAQVKTQYGVVDTQTDEVRPVSNVVERDGKLVGVTGQTFGNKATGQAIDSGYGRWQNQGGENLFGGTGEGKGNTGYRVQFADDGTPIFYTTKGTSNDLAQLMTDLGPIGQIGLAVATGGMSLPAQLATNFAIQVLSGTDLKDAIKNTAVNLAVAQIPGTDFMKEVNLEINKLGLDPSVTKTLTNAAQGAATSATRAALTGQSILDSALTGAASGGVNGAVSEIMKGIPDFDKLTPAQQRMASNAITGVISGKPLDQVIVNTAIAAANAEIHGSKSTSTSPSTTGVDKATVGNFDDNEVTRLEKLGYTKDQIKDYFGRLDNLTEIFDEPQDPLAVDGQTTGTRSLTGTDTGSDVVKNLEDAGLTQKADDNVLVTGKLDKTEPTTSDDIVNLLISGNRDKTKEHVFDPTFGGTKPLPVTDPNEVVITDKRPTTSTSDTTRSLTPSTPIRDEGEVVITDKRIAPKPELDLSTDPVKLITNPPTTTVPPTTQPPTTKPTTGPTTGPSTPSINIDPVKQLEEFYNPFTPTRSAPVQTDTGPIQLMTDVFGTDISKAQKTGARGYGFSAGGDIDELLRLLRS